MATSATNLLSPNLYHSKFYFLWNQKGCNICCSVDTSQSISTDLSPVGSNYSKAEIILDVKYIYIHTHTHTYFDERVISSNPQALSFGI